MGASRVPLIDLLSLPNKFRSAFAAWQRFGQGRHPAGLNVGDCFSYAAAKLAGAPLLFKGTDFSQTDVESAAV